MLAETTMLLHENQAIARAFEAELKQVEQNIVEAEAETADAKNRLGELTAEITKNAKEHGLTDEELKELLDDV